MFCVKLLKIIKCMFLWLLQSFLLEILFAIMVVGLFIIFRFIPDYNAPLAILWIITISFIYIKYGKV